MRKARSRERKAKGRRVGRRAREGRTAAGTADEGVALAVPQQEQEEQREEVWDLSAECTAFTPLSFTIFT